MPNENGFRDGLSARHRYAFAALRSAFADGPPNRLTEELADHIRVLASFRSLHRYDDHGQRQQAAASWVAICQQVATYRDWVKDELYGATVPIQEAAVLLLLGVDENHAINILFHFVQVNVLSREVVVRALDYLRVQLKASVTAREMAFDVLLPLLDRLDTCREAFRVLQRMDPPPVEAFDRLLECVDFLATNESDVDEGTVCDLADTLAMIIGNATCARTASRNYAAPIVRMFTGCSHLHALVADEVFRAILPGSQRFFATAYGPLSLPARVFGVENYLCQHFYEMQSLARQHAASDARYLSNGLRQEFEWGLRMASSLTDLFTASASGNLPEDVDVMHRTSESLVGIANRNALELAPIQIECLPSIVFPACGVRLPGFRDELRQCLGSCASFATQVFSEIVATSTSAVAVGWSLVGLGELALQAQKYSRVQLQRWAPTDAGEPIRDAVRNLKNSSNTIWIAEASSWVHNLVNRPRERTYGEEPLLPDHASVRAFLQQGKFRGVFIHFARVYSNTNFDDLFDEFVDFVCSKLTLLNAVTADMRPGWWIVVFRRWLCSRGKKCKWDSIIKVGDFVEAFSDLTCEPPAFREDESHMTVAELLDELETQVSIRWLKPWQLRLGVSLLARGTSRVDFADALGISLNRTDYVKSHLRPRDSDCGADQNGRPQ